MATRGLVLYLLSGFSVAVLSVFFFAAPSGDVTYPPSNLASLNTTLSRYSFSLASYSSSTRVWPELEFSWRIVLATVIGFLGSAFGTVGGVGGGGIFVPMLTLIVGFDTKSAAALSKCMIMGASTSSVWYNLRVDHPTKEAPIIDYDLALLFQPMLMLGITVGVSLSVVFPYWLITVLIIILFMDYDLALLFQPMLMLGITVGVSLSVVFPYWLITVLIIILFMGTSTRSLSKAVQMWKEETILKKELEEQRQTMVNSRGELLLDAEYEPLVPREEKSLIQKLQTNLRWKGIVLLVTVWAIFLLLQILKNDSTTCSVWYWVLFLLQFPVAVVVYGYEAVKLHKEYKKRIVSGNTEAVCEANIEWTVLNLAFCALCGILGGTVGGLLGSGGGFILGPLLLEIGVIPQVASATATFVMMFSSSLSVVEFYLLKRFPIPYALYLIAVSVTAGFWGQFFIRKLVAFLKRGSIIVFILSGVIFASALTMGVVGIKSSITMIHDHEFMGFLSFCDNQ